LIFLLALYFRHTFDQKETSMEKPLLNNENRKQQKQFGQVDRSHSNEQGRKVLFALSQLVGVVISIWISQFGGITTVGK